MNVNEYDERGRTPLMNAAIEGDLQGVKRLLELGADPDIKDKSFGTTKAVNFAGRRAGGSEIHREIYDFLSSVSSNASTITDIAGKSPAPLKQDYSDPERETDWPYETYRAVSGRHVTRVRSSVFYLGGVGSILVGIILLSNEQISGGFLILFLAPCLLLYPAVRFLFGGKDSIAAAVTTVVVEEFLKSEIRNAAKKNSNKRR